jgi:hypothetical protein
VLVLPGLRSRLRRVAGERAETKLRETSVIEQKPPDVMAAW